MAQLQKRMRARTFSKALQRKRESWAFSAALPQTAACTEDATGNAFRCYFFFSVGPWADAERGWDNARALARVCARAGVVRACGRAGAAPKHRGCAFSVWEHECVRRMQRGTTGGPAALPNGKEPSTYLPSQQLLFQVGGTGNRKKRLKKDTTVRAAHRPPFACSPTWFALWVLGNRFRRVPRVAFKKCKSMVASKEGGNNDHRKWKRIVGVNK